MADPAAIRRVLAERGPQTGAELHAALGGEVFGLWKTCRSTDEFTIQVVGTRYLRLDRTVPGFARLSPSILREFMTYSVIGLAEQQGLIGEKAKRLHARTRMISRAKRRTAERFTDEIWEVVGGRGVAMDDFCVLIAGDVVYQMSHDVTRQESSSGGRVDGSDLDLVVLASDEAPAEAVDALEAAILERKWLYLRSPALREEVDYVVKRLSRLAEQTAFDSFPHMVACKVFDEAQFLRGNRGLHDAGRGLLDASGVLAKLREMEAQAAERRLVREAYLLSVPGETLPDDGRQQFYTDEEAAEFEHRG